jgi:uncharacterized membrane protein
MSKILWVNRRKGSVLSEFASLVEKRTSLLASISAIDLLAETERVEEVGYGASPGFLDVLDISAAVAAEVICAGQTGVGAGSSV